MSATTNGAAPRLTLRGRSLCFLLGALALACSSSASDGARAEVLDSAQLLERAHSSPTRAVLVNFWATWCPPCLAEMPALVATRGDFPADEVLILAVSMDLVSPQGIDTVEEVSAFAAKHGIDLPVVVLQDDLEKAQELFDVTALPRTVLYSKGVQRSFHEGPASREQFGEMIRAALADAGSAAR